LPSSSSEAAPQFQDEEWDEAMKYTPPSEENLRDRFVRESNKIEGIYRKPTPEELAEFDRFMGLDRTYVADMIQFVSVYHPNAVLRNLTGLDVRVGNHIAPSGGPDIELRLVNLLAGANKQPPCFSDPFEVHLEYETLHPFTDCNGRSGRMLWAWQMRDLSLGFLHRFYYQTLGASR